ncbi:hypothetical protein [Nakamurella sp.]|uniref:hypothetical protein n=1 Tax=Nakamurella sp. TaxID=1869182 RepID=UPI003783C50E
MEQFQATISIPQVDLQDLQSDGAHLYVFRRVLSADTAGRPVLWSDVAYSETTTVQWSDGLQAYTSAGPIVGGDQVHPGFAVTVAPGQLLTVDGTGCGQVTANGHPGVVSILNESTRQFDCGLSAALGSGPVPFCVGPLGGSDLQILQPAPTILLLFSTRIVEPGTVITDFYDGIAQTAYSPAVLIDFATGNRRALAYACAQGWSWGKYTWARQVAAGTDLVPLLVVRPTSSGL